LLIGAAVLALLILQFTTRALSSLWPVWLTAALLAPGSIWMLRQVKAGRGAATAEETRREAIAEAQRHRELAALDTMAGTAFERHIANLCNATA
jgi:hypothetical protein